LSHEPYLSICFPYVCGGQSDLSTIAAIIGGVSLNDSSYLGDALLFKPCVRVLLRAPVSSTTRPLLLLHCSLWLPRASLCPEHCQEVVRFSYVLRVCLCVAQTLACGSHGVCRLSLVGSGNNTEVVQACDCFDRYISPYVGRLQGRLLSPISCVEHSCCSCLVRFHLCFPYLDRIPSEIYTILQGIEQALQGYRASPKFEAGWGRRNVWVDKTTCCFVSARVFLPGGTLTTFLGLLHVPGCAEAASVAVGQQYPVG
jgi:hypothetical protein